MNKQILLIVLLLVSVMLSAAPVSRKRSLDAAQRFMTAEGCETKLKLVDTKEMGICLTHIRLYRSENGFVLVSADDCVRPVLGYSVSNQFNTTNLPPQIKGWLEDMDSRIGCEMANNNKPTLATRRLWAALDSRTTTARAPGSVKTVGPLITTTWNQSPYYNYYAPYDAYAGCVAIAQAQIMKYWNHPTRGWGSHSYYCNNTGTTESADFGNTTYDWAHMPTELNGSSSMTEINAVALLAYHVGVAVDMGYLGPGGSGAQSISYGDPDYPSSENAYLQYFRYRAHGVAAGDYSDQGWKALLKSELDAGRPIQYSGNGGDGGGGHAFVVDGYDAKGMFHINWGWGGYCDGYYAMGELNPAPGGQGGSATSKYNNNNKAIIGIMPDTATVPGAEVTLNAVSNDTAMGRTSGGGRYTALTDMFLYTAQAAPGFRLKEWNDGVKYNPYENIVTGASRTDTAIFEPVLGDTLYYCSELCGWSFGNINSDSTAYNAPCTWGIRLDPKSLISNKPLAKIRILANSEGGYCLTIYEGGTTEPDTTVLLRDTLQAQGHRVWQELVLKEPFVPDSSKSLWIVFHTDTVHYPVCFSSHRGQDDGCMWLDENGWQVFNNGNKRAWAIKAVFDDRPCRISVEVHPDCEGMGYTEGTGEYRFGDKVTMRAVPYRGYEFERWTDGQDIRNPREKTVKGNTIYFCRFRVNNNPQAEVYVDGREAVVVIEATEAEVEIYDAEGRTITRAHQSAFEARYALPGSGVYVVTVDNQPTKIVVR